VRVVKQKRKSGKQTSRVTRVTRPTTTSAGETAMYTRLGKRFALAWISHLMHTRYETADKNYGHNVPGSYWIDLAKMVSNDFRDGHMHGGSEATE